MKVEVERIRFRGESDHAAVLRSLPGVEAMADRVVLDPVRIRRSLMARSLLLSEGMAPGPYRVARAVAEKFGIGEPLEIYQAAGAENAALHTIPSPVLIEIQGRLLSLLDDDTMAALLGHELGHYLAHGKDDPGRGPALAAMAILHSSGAPEELFAAAQRLSMARELTADRFGLLAGPGLDAALRLEMVVVTGLAAGTLGWDTTAYLAQSRDLMEATLAEGATAHGTSHPEHSLRAWATWLFSETEVYRELTGSGPATRKLAEVDDLLMRVLGRPELELGVATTLDEPPVEVHECALAACVLVAAADREIHDLELQAIERVFASLVPAFRDSLEPERALAEFQRLAPLVAAGGPKLQRSLFSLLAHVLAVDGACDPAEVEMILAIGGALGCRGLFLDLLPPVLLHFGLRVVEALSAPERSLPMPARGADAQEALSVYFEGVRRRGGGVVTLRRLARITGARQATPELVARLGEAAASSGLDLAPPLDQELDSPHRLDPVDRGATLGIEVPSPPAEGSGEVGGRVRRGLARLRDRLISGDGRSPSIRLQLCRPGRAFDLHDLEEVSTGLSERTLALVRGGKRARVVEAVEVGSHEGARKASAALVQLERERATRYEETGADDLFLGYPFLTGLAGGYLFRAPLVLYPVRIERAARGAGAVALSVPAGLSPIANQPALRLLFHKKGFSYPDELAERADELAAVGPETLLGELTSLGLGTVGSLDQLRPFEDRKDELAEWRDDRLEIEECGVLGLFPQSSSDLLQDYDELLASLDAGTAPGELLGSATEVLPAEIRKAFPALEASSALRATVPVAAPAAPPIPVLYADPVQREVLAAARHTRALVVDGPPGTGKSQVIVNLVADALARGERVAVVCEKRAALDVVAHRLSGVGLRHLLAVVHDVYEDRRPLYAQVAARLESQEARTHDPAALAAVGVEAGALEASLARRASVSGETQGNLPLGQLHTYAAGLAVENPCRVDDLAALSLSGGSHLAGQISALHSYAGLWRTGAPWRAPHGQPPRPSVAFFDETRTGAALHEMLAAREKAAALESTLEAAALPAEPATLRQLSAVRASVEAVLRSRPVRAEAVGQDAFLALVSGAAEALPSAVEKSQPAWQAVIESRPRREGESGNRLFAALVAGLVTRPDGQASLLEVARLWDESSRDLDLFPEPVRFQVDGELEAALKALRSLVSSPFRFLSPAWWRGRKVLAQSLAAQWPEQAAARVDLALVERAAARGRAARCWAAQRDALGWVSPGEAPGSLAEARRWVTACAALARPAQAVAACRPALQALGAWQEAPGASAVAEWESQAERWVDWHRRARDLRTTVSALLENEESLKLLAAWPDRWTRASLAAWDERIDRLRNAAEAEAALVQAAAPVRSLLPWLPDHPTSSALAHLAEAWRRDSTRLVTADRLLGVARDVHPRATDFPPHLADRPDLDSPASWGDGVRKSWTRASIAALEARQPGVLAVDLTSSQALRTDEERLGSLHDAQRRLAVEAILAGQDRSPLLAAPAPEKGARRTPEQATREAIAREAKKQRSILPLRGFVRRFWDKGLLDLLPVWLLSPETASMLFPRTAVFDLVIFDEASQCTVENGLPVLMRARRAVIAGDERQMPPTSFFKAAGDEEAAEERDEAREMFDAESLLVLARHRTRHLGLSWHYRCQHEELIAFSNHAIYGGSLRTIPSTVSRLGPAAVRWIDVPDGRYEDGANVPEARQVVDLVEKLLRQDPAPSVGVVTFNLTQRRATLDEIDRRLAADPAFVELWNRANGAPRVDDRPFVKNLETVQGDERDVIVFSLGHAPVERVRRDGKTERYVPARFGPLGQRGGERRLNVAVSRARKETWIVASFDPHQLSVARSKHDGPRLFKGFLLFARQLSAGQRNQADQTLAMMRAGSAAPAREEIAVLPESWMPLNAQIALALEAEGLSCELDVGTSGFRVPLAVVDKANPERYLLGLLLDEAVDPGTVFERHVHVPEVLATRGWKLLRFSSREWDVRKKEVLEDIRVALG